MKSGLYPGSCLLACCVQSGHQLPSCVSAGHWSGESDEGSENIPNLRGHQRHLEALCCPQWLPGKVIFLCFVLFIFLYLAVMIFKIQTFCRREVFSASVLLQDAVKSSDIKGTSSYLFYLC